ncbi:hypothetical protein HYC85_002145, partial [Camellia sinensis]
AEPETDEVYAQITLHPEADQFEPTSPDLSPPEQPKQTIHSFCKILTASDTSTHGGSTSKTFAYDRLEYFCDFQKISCRGCFCFPELCDCQGTIRYAYEHYHTSNDKHMSSVNTVIDKHMSSIYGVHPLSPPNNIRFRGPSPIFS